MSQDYTLKEGYRVCGIAYMAVEMVERKGRLQYSDGYWHRIMVECFNGSLQDENDQLKVRLVNAVWTLSHWQGWSGREVGQYLASLMEFTGSSSNALFKKTVYDKIKGMSE